jgi:hypothetical protein
LVVGKSKAVGAIEAREEDAIPTFNLIVDHLSGAELEPQALRTVVSGISKSFAASGNSSSRGKPQCPSSSASVKTKEIPARVRIIAVFSMPSFMATSSAVLKPMTVTGQPIGSFRDQPGPFGAIGL